MHGEIDPSVSRIALHYIRIIVRGSVNCCIRTMSLHVSNNSVDKYRVIGIQSNNRTRNSGTVENDSSGSRQINVDHES